MSLIVFNSILIFGPPSLVNNLGDESSSPISFFMRLIYRQLM
jgi:hypothetical protein